MKAKLLIWDFDGVIANTEKLWLKNWLSALNETFHLNWDDQKVHQTLLGISDKTKREVLQNLGIITDDAFLAKINKMNYDVMLSEGFTLTEGIEDIFQSAQSRNLKQCIATGGTKHKTAVKIQVVGIQNYFPSNHIFTSDMVARGKPEPDLFLFAAEQMGESPKDTIVIEDSIAGLQAALKAGCIPVAFTQHMLLNQSSYISQIKDLGIEHIFNNMNDIKNFISDNT
ncbi:MAG: HAD family phosphatase [Alphaproteobacteria bacterium]|nr:HAD family phosphatase [Alphaproteobacteria bacterium]